MAYRSVALVILDGWGHAPAWGGNAISQARTPFVSWLDQQPHAYLAASGTAVGLSGHERGNSEVGHLTLGAGRIIEQDSTRISQAIHDGSFARNQVLQAAFRQAVAQKTTVHLMGLLTKTAVHASLEHVYALVDLAKTSGVTELKIHAFMDGRDNDPRDGLGLIDALETYLQTRGIGVIQSIAGRYYAMDRDQHWDRIEPVYRLLTQGVGQAASSARGAVSQAYAIDTTDEFIQPTLITAPGQSRFKGFAANDTVIFWNFRADRARQLTEALTEPNFEKIDRPVSPPHLNFMTLTPYGAGQDLPGVMVAFPRPHLDHTLAQLIASGGARQFHIAETEKYAHVTYFFNGGTETTLPGEDRILIPSANVATFDQAPAMAARQIRERLEVAIRDDRYQLLVANFANADMVGHTGNFTATLQAIETIDTELNQLAKTCEKTHIPLIITADHGNAEQKVNPQTGEPSTDHTTNPVPAYCLAPRPITFTRTDGALADIAPTVLHLLGITQPAMMIGQSLVTVS